MKRSYELQGHRGARGLFAENTLSGFLGALACGVDSIELDIAVTRDDVAVVVHDSVLNADLTRDADGAWLSAPGPAIRTLTLAQLRRYDVGRMRPESAAAQAHPDQRAFDGASIPTLEDVFAASAPAGVIIDAELKTDPLFPAVTVRPGEMADIVVATARRCLALDRLVVRSFDWRGLFHMRLHHPEIPLAWLTGAVNGGDTVAQALQRVAEHAAGADRSTWAPLHTTLDRATVAEAQDRGLRVVPWTVNDPVRMNELLDWGVDGLCTDRPDLAPRR